MEIENKKVNEKIQSKSTKKIGSQNEKTSKSDKNKKNNIFEELLKKYQTIQDFEQLKQSEEWEMGIDEAGRGPVLGPMVYGSCVWPTSLKIELSKLGFADSKQLTEEQRDDLFELIKQLNQKCLQYEVEVLSPLYLSNNMLKTSKVNLNDISHNTAIQLIEKMLNQKVNLVQVYLDTVGPAEKYQQKLQNIFSYEPKVKFTVSEKADSKFPVVSAASICAKVTRDSHLKNWEFKGELNNKLKKDFGGGYPGNPQTVKWLEQNLNKVFGYPDIVRVSWNTITKIYSDKLVEYKFEKQVAEGSISSYLSKSKQDKPQRCQFFENLEINDKVSLL